MSYGHYRSVGNVLGDILKLMGDVPDLSPASAKDFTELDGTSLLIPNPPVQQPSWVPFTPLSLTSRTSFHAQMRMLNKTYLSMVWGDIPYDPEPLAPLEETISETCVIGYRAWRLKVVGTRTAYLIGTGADYLWPHGEPAEVLPNDGTNVFDRTSYTGVHAFKSMHECVQQFANTSTPCFGEVELGGKMFAHAHGYRAEVGYPRKIFVLYRDVLDGNVARRLTSRKQSEGHAQLLRRGYGCEVEVIGCDAFTERVQRSYRTSAPPASLGDCTDTPQ